MGTHWNHLTKATHTRSKCMLQEASLAQLVDQTPDRTVAGSNLARGAVLCP